MPRAADNSTLTTRLFLEGLEIDLTEDIDINNTYSVNDVRTIGSKNSSYSKTITVPGSARNNKLLAFLFDIESTGAEVNPANAPAGSNITNNIPGVTITDVYLSGSTYVPPIDYGTAQSSGHYNINNSDIYINISGQTDSSGFIVCYVNGVVISCNRLTAAVSQYFFPYGNYQFNDLLEIVLSQNAVPFNGNIGYDLDFRKKMKAYVIQDNAIILSGYAKIVSANSVDGYVTYDLQITSDLGGFIAALANLRLEDLYVAIAPNYLVDPNGQVSKTIALASPYDHEFQIANITQSWVDDVFNEKPYAYPLIDYGNDDTVALTNFYTSTLRPALYAKSYWDEIFKQAGYTYSSAFLNSDNFKSLIIPYKDGNISIVRTNPVLITTSGETSIPVEAVSATDPVNSFYPYDTIVNDQEGVYSGTTYTCKKTGNYVASVAFSFFYQMTSDGTSAGIQLQNQDTFIFIHFEQWHSGGIAPYMDTVQVYEQKRGLITFLGNNYFLGGGSTVVSDTFIAQVLNVPINIQTAGDEIRIRISSSANAIASTYFIEKAFSFTYPGSGELFLINGEGTQPTLNVSYSTNLDGQFLTFEDFVPKSVKQIDYINSIIKLFNLYPVQDRDQRNHFNIYTRDEFFSNQNTLDWTNKIDKLSDITVCPIPELDAAQLLFAYKQDKDWWNKQYDSLYGDFTYGSLRVQTGYEFANTVNDVVSGLIFGPTPVVEYDQQTYPGESNIEIINGFTTLTGSFPASDDSSSIVLVSGYYAGNGNQTPCEAQPAPTGNSVSGAQFTKAKVGVKIIYWGVEYLISRVMNPWAFQVTDLDGNPTTLRRPITQGSNERISNTLYAANDGFFYVTNSNIAVPSIYDSSDNNATHKPVKTEMKILYYKKLTGSPEIDKTYNPFYIQLTPVLQNNSFIYQATGFATSASTDAQINKLVSYPYCSHLNDPDNPTFDLLFGKPVSLFFPFDPTKYPTSNLYTKHWINTVNEILDKDAKLVKATLNLNSVDISTLDLSNNIYINGTNFRINQIKDYSPDGSLTQCEFIRRPLQIPVSSDMTVDAGADIFASGTTEAPLHGIVTWADGGTAGEYAQTVLWTVISGPALVFADATSLITTVDGIVEGDTYILQLSVTDNYGMHKTDTLRIIGAPLGPCTPFVSTSNDGDITLPTSTNNICATAEGCGNYIAALRLTFDNIANAPVSTLADWNTFFSTSDPFTSMEIHGNEVRLFGSSNINIADSLFYQNTHLISIIDGSLVIANIGSESFYQCSALTTIDFPVSASIGASCFLQSPITKAIFPKVTSLTSNTFYNCTALTTAHFPLCTTMTGDNNFYVCTALSDISFGSLATMGNGEFALNACTSISLPALTTCGDGCFGSSPNLSVFSAPGLITCGSFTWQLCTALSSINIGACTTLGPTTGDNNNFQYIVGRTITLTIPTATATDGDVVTLQANNTVTLILT